jgi:cell division protein FtsW
MIAAELPAGGKVAAGQSKPATAAPSRLAWLDRPLASFHLILVTTGLLTVIGMVMVLSASSIDSITATHSAFSVFKKQLLWLVIGVPIFWLGVRLPPRAYRRLAYPALILSFLGLLAVLVPGVGLLVSGARRWIDIGPLQLQPSEPAKLALALWGADLLVRKEKLCGQMRHLLIPLVPVATAAAALIMLEPDLGTTMCVVLVLFGLLWTVGAPVRLFGMIVGGAAAVVVALIIKEPYRLARLTSFLHPASDASGNGYQAVRGLQALGSGGWLGVGLGQSRFKWGLLPNAHTDYIFAIVGEELGLLGCLLVLALFAVLAYAGLRIARRTSDPFVRLASAAVTFWLTGQAIINIGYVTGLLPVTGIPLPLISFGGTSLIATLFALGMLASFARHEPEAVASLARKGRSRWARLLLLPQPDLGYLTPPRKRRSTASRGQSATRRQPARPPVPAPRRGERGAAAPPPAAAKARGTEARRSAGAGRSRARAATAQTRTGNRTGTDGRNRR